MKWAAVFLGLTGWVFAAETGREVTFYKDVLPVLQKNCQGCHRPGEAAPMALLTYEQTRPWAKAIKESVSLHRMPPWPADPHVGTFSNDRSLSASEIKVLTDWAGTGAKPGATESAPPPRRFVDGWNIGTPDQTFEMTAEYQVPSSGTLEYTYFVIPTGFQEDRWVQLAEARPGNRAVVHHVIAFVREPGSKWMRNAKPGVPFVPNKENGGSEGPSGELLVGYAPGTVPTQLAAGQAKLVKAGSDIVLQMHYTTNGKSATDRTRIGLVFAKEPPRERVMTLAATTHDFVIPAGAPNHQVDSRLTLYNDAKLVAMIPHMHLRGRDFEFRAVYPTGESQTLLRVPRYDFNWQLSYYPSQQLVLPKGTRIECTAHYDNSVNNPANPDPTKDVRYGDQSWEEMMFGFFDVAFDAHMNPESLIRAPKKPAASALD